MAVTFECRPYCDCVSTVSSQTDVLSILIQGIGCSTEVDSPIMISAEFEYSCFEVCCYAETIVCTIVRHVYIRIPVALYRTDNTHACYRGKGVCQVAQIKGEIVQSILRYCQIACTSVGGQCSGSGSCSIVRAIPV